MGHHLSCSEFRAELKIIGINPYVSVPEGILAELFQAAAKSTSPIPILGTVNQKPYKQTLVRYRGAWRLYINAAMLEDSPRRIGETVTVSVGYDPSSRELEPHPGLMQALVENPAAKTAFDGLTPSVRKEIVRYISSLKTAESQERNIQRAMAFLQGKARFIGRAPNSR